ncbi:MAG TPA: cellulase family glycosylhydrolase [Bryobacteraceae bacterium]|jgi:hypothetical protein|nr:cellulase family glycosylhydrolase [Bryobacteraceae bacterium]
MFEFPERNSAARMARKPLYSRIELASKLPRGLTVALLFSGAAAAQITNAWPNPGAESGIAGATVYSPDGTGSTVSRQKADGWRGRSSFQLRFTAGASGSAALVFGAGKGPEIHVTAGQICHFRVAGRLFAGSPETELELRARWLDASGALVSERPGLCHIPALASRTWTVLDGWDTVPAGAARAAAALYATNAAGVTVLRADGVQMTIEPARLPAYVDGEQPGCSWQGTRESSPSRCPAAAVNLVPNPSFEYGITTWKSAAPGASIRSFGRNSSWASAGRTSIRLAGTVAGGRGSDISISSQPIPVTGGEEYTLRGTLNVARIPPGGEVALTLRWLDSNGKYLARESTEERAVVGVPGVRVSEITGAAPRNAAAAIITAASAGDASGDYDFSADGFSLLADSGAAPSRPFFVGFNDQLLNRGPLTLEQDLSYDARLGVNAVRLPINLSLNDLYKQVWPSPEARINLDPVAPMIDAFFKAGIRVLLLSPITPWMMKDRHLDPDRYADVGRLSAAFVRRWPQIVAVEAHNEPNAANFWPPAADPVQFVRYLEAVYRAVKAVDPAMPVLAPSCNAPLTNTKNLSIPDYMKAFYSAGGGRWCDALSIHPYPYGASSGSGTDQSRPFWMGSNECMRQIRAVRDAFHDSGKPIWITELGSATTDPAYPPLLKTITEDQQARSTVLLYDWARRQPDVRAIIYHTNASRPNPREGDFGIFTADGRLKPAFLAFQAELHRTELPYFDGDSRGCRWTGQPGASPSIRAQ